MKKIMIALLSLISVSAFSQTADEIVQKYATAIGGLDGFNKLTSAKMTGTVDIQGMSLPLTMQVLNNKGFRLDVDAMGQQVVSVYYNGAGWKLNPFEGAETATDLSENELKDVKAQANLANPLVDYKSRGHKVELIGEEKVEGVNCYHLKLTAKEDGKITDYFISSADYLMIKTVTKKSIQGADVDMETWFSNYKEFNGLKFAMTKTNKVNGNVAQEVNYTNIELNVAIDESIFKK